VTFFAAAFISFDVGKFAGWVVRRVMTCGAAAIFKAFLVALMGKSDRGPPQASEDIIVGQYILGFLGY
jgi:hypothetical protein